MNLSNGLTTLLGSFLLPFMILLMWDRLVQEYKVLGGLMSAGFIVGTAWVLNHGLGFIYQSGGAWVDMALAAGVGGLTYSLLQGKSFKHAVPNLLAALTGALVSGFILALFF